MNVDDRPPTTLVRSPRPPARDDRLIVLARKYERADWAISQRCASRCRAARLSGESLQSHGAPHKLRGEVGTQWGRTATGTPPSAPEGGTPTRAAKASPGPLSPLMPFLAFAGGRPRPREVKDGGGREPGLVHALGVAPVGAARAPVQHSLTRLTRPARPAAPGRAAASGTAAREARGAPELEGTERVPQRGRCPLQDGRDRLAREEAALHMCMGGVEKGMFSASPLRRRF